MAEKFGRVESYKEGEYEATPATQETKADETMTETQRRMSEVRGANMEKGLDLVMEDSTDLSDEERRLWPTAARVHRYSGGTKDGRKVDLVEAFAYDNRGWRGYMGKINGEAIPTEITQKLVQKYKGDARDVKLEANWAAQANRELEEGAKAKLWEDLL